MTPEDMAQLHAAAFEGHGRPWSADEFAELLQARHVFAVHAPGALALGRVVAGEAELLTIATRPADRRRGLGRAMLTRFETEAAARGARKAFLEVAEDNCAARALYAAAGYGEIGRRRAYYPRPGTARADALVLQKPLG